MFRPSQDHVFKARFDREILGEKLALARLRKGFTQADALREAGLLIEDEKNRTHEAGVTRGFLTYIEAGTRGINKTQLTALAKLYGESIKYFISKVELTERDRTILKNLRNSVPRGPQARKVTTMVHTDRRPVATARVPSTRTVTAPQRRMRQMSQVAAIGPTITPGDLALLDAVRDCSEPEKVWLTDGVLKLKARMRPAAPAPTKPPTKTRHLAVTY